MLPRGAAGGVRTVPVSPRWRFMPGARWGEVIVIRLKDKIAVVTGASRGIGRAIAIEFARQGAAVTVAYLRQADKAEAVAAEIAAAGGRVFPVQLDVRSRDQCRKAFAATAAHFGGIDILVNNAGINKRATFEETTDADWDEIMAVNLKGPFICCQEVFPYMIDRGGGRIINISSVAGEYHGPKTVHYAVSKAGLNSLTKVLARYGAKHNIMVNAVAPGLMLTDQTADEIAGPGGHRIIDMTLLKRPGTLSDVADACVFLASEAQNYTTGQVLSVSGGAIL